MARPKSADPTVPLTFRLPQSLVERLDEVRAGATRAVWVRELIERAVRPRISGPKDLTPAVLKRMDEADARAGRRRPSLGAGSVKAQRQVTPIPKKGKG